MISPRVDVPLATHGGRLAIDTSDRDVLDFSVCLNAFGPADCVREALHSARLDEYPDPASRLAREAAAAAWNCPVDDIALGAGAAELIDAACRAFLSPRNVVSIEQPAFGEYERSVRLCGASVANNLESKARLVFVCSPSNPLGKLREKTELLAIADRCASRGALLVLDQAYDAFSGEPLGTPAFPGHSAVLHLRSLTKEHALAGVRVAYAVAPREVIRAVNAVRVPWSASSLTQAAAIATFTPDAHVHASDTIATLRAEAARLRVTFMRLGYEVSESSTHFFLVRVSSAPRAQRLLLERENILVRDCTSFGLPDRIRVAARTPLENDLLIDAFYRLSVLLRP
jgi:histidinol-phosphate/aromatic aminotransferase/cobyric acid decarboxylase-like protein